MNIQDKTLCDVARLVDCSGLSLQQQIPKFFNPALGLRSKLKLLKSSIIAEIIIHGTLSPFGSIYYRCTLSSESFLCPNTYHLSSIRPFGNISLINYVG